MVGSLSIFFMVVSEILAIGVPVACLIYFVRKHQISWKPILVGVLVFIVFSQILEKLLHVYVLTINPQTMAWMKNPYIYALYGGLAAGVFEEVGRFIGFRYLLKKYREWKDGIAYGIGHGGFETLLVGGLAILQSMIFAFMINSGGFEAVIQASGGGQATAALQAMKDQLVGAPSYYFLMGGLERVFAFVLQLALSLVVLYGMRNGKNVFLLYAILIHAAVDFIAALANKLHFNVLAIEGFLCIIAILSAIFIGKSKNWFAKTVASGE